MNKGLKEIVFSKNTVEFVTIANEFCAFVENLDDANYNKYCDKSLKMLSLLYLKASLLPHAEQINEDGNEKFVTEFDWQFIRNGIANIFNDNDTYLDFFDSEMNETPEPVMSSISENIADIYQDLKDFLEIYKLGNEELSNDAIYECNDSFKNYWGFKVVNTIRILHILNFKSNETINSNISKNKTSRSTNEWFVSRRQQDFQSND